MGADPIDLLSAAWNRLERAGAALEETPAVDASAAVYLVDDRVADAVATAVAVLDAAALSLEMLATVARGGALAAPDPREGVAG